MANRENYVELPEELVAPSGVIKGIEYLNRVEFDARNPIEPALWHKRLANLSRKEKVSLHIDPDAIESLGIGDTRELSRKGKLVHDAINEVSRVRRPGEPVHSYRDAISRGELSIDIHPNGEFILQKHDTTPEPLSQSIDKTLAAD